MILVNSGAFLNISSWFCELAELIFVMIPYISSTGYPPTTQGIMGHVQVANWVVLRGCACCGWPVSRQTMEKWSLIPRSVPVCHLQSMFSKGEVHAGLTPKAGSRLPL